MTTTSSPWERMKSEARRYSEAEVQRHARVSLANRHKCEECFTCACAEVLREREAAGKPQSPR